MKESDRILGQIEARIADLQQDVVMLRTDVETLKKDLIQRTVIYKAMSWAIGILTTISTITINYMIRH